MPEQREAGCPGLFAMVAGFSFAATSFFGTCKIAEHRRAFGHEHTGLRLDRPGFAASGGGPSSLSPPLARLARGAIDQTGRIGSGVAEQVTHGQNYLGPSVEGRDLLSVAR
jgi:hypothetical protein